MTKKDFDDLFQKQRNIQQQSRNIEQAISTLQGLCEHKWKHEGHSHKEDLYVCLICRSEKWE